MPFTVDKLVMSDIVDRIKYMKWLEDASIIRQTPVYTHGCVFNFKYDIRHTMCFII